MIGIPALALAGVCVAGCSLGAAPSPDDLAGWSSTPLPPDPRLAVIAGTNEACQSRSVFLNATLPPPFTEPMQVVVQDRRTSRTAGFVVATTGYVGSCVISTGGQGFGYLPEGTLAQIESGMAVAGAVSGLLGAGEGSWVWGRAEARIASIGIDLASQLHVVDDDDRMVEASLGRGYWIGWWPDAATAVVITGRDAQGKIVASMKTTDDGWVAE
jgi:hypothetical protein